jgi:hypothetical protein
MRKAGLQESVTEHHTVISMLSDKEYAKVEMSYTGWYWRPPAGELLGTLTRGEMEAMLSRSLIVYDWLSESVRQGKGKVDKTITRRKVVCEVCLYAKSMP